MKELRYYILGILALCLTACDKDDLLQQDSDNGEFYLRATVENQVVTRAPYTLTAPTTEQPLLATVYASTYTNAFPNLGENGQGGSEKVAIHTTANFQNSGPQLLNGPIYPKKSNGDPYDVNFVAFYPQTPWTAQADGTKTEFTFDGSQDVMFAPSIVGKYGSVYPTISFKHLLTWLRISVMAESEDVSIAWGKITNLKIKSKNRVIVDLSLTDDDVTQLVTYDNDTPMPFYATGSNNTIFPDVSGYTLPYDKFHEVAYVLCSPVVSPVIEVVDGVDTEVGEFLLYLETEKRNAVLPVYLYKDALNRFSGSTRAHRFDIKLLFHMGSSVSASGAVVDWFTGGIGYGGLDE
ncbi:MAG: fimbrillin family protein [Bacteroidaceae bacterium]|nr:fimbrillin family protein [Bacteroidaceae bacterium]